MNRWLENERIRLRAIEPLDAAVIYAWENDTRTWHYGSTLAPYSRGDINEFIDSSSHSIYDDKQLRLMIVDRSTGSTVGMIDLFDYDPHHAHAALGLYIDDAYKRMGYAREAVAIMEQYAFDFLHIHLLYAHIPVSNQGCIRLFDDMQYIRMGTLTQWIRILDGWDDVAVYGKLKVKS